MRVLWFSNTPSLAAKGFEKFISGGSWIESLENELMKYSQIELGVVFKKLVKEPKEMISKTGSTRYFVVPRHPYGKLDRWYYRIAIRPPSKKSLNNYLRIVDEFNPDVILFFGTESDFPLIIPELKIPSIIWFQGNLTVYNRMYENGIKVRKTISQERIKDLLMGDSIFHNYLHFQHLVHREKQIFSCAKNFIGRTDWDRRLVNILAPQAKYYCCEEALRQPFFDKQWKQWQNREIFVITTTIGGNLYKGLETIFETSALLKDLINRKLEWRVIGIQEGTTYVKVARKKANYPSSNPSVKLLGFKSADEIVEELLKADMYVHPSHIENSPNAVQEAMLLGMPVIATNVGGTPSLLKDGEEGLLVQNKDPYSMAGAIFELYKSPDIAKKIGKNARKRGLVRNNSRSICDHLLGIFDELIQHKI